MYFFGLQVDWPVTGGPLSGDGGLYEEVYGIPVYTEIGLLHLAATFNFRSTQSV